ncbi:MAG: PQQ-binding-like beta-propeller repeat protein [Endomicrobia bacterium]|nr:PQQ-binding-like beta-propeller repeat protein [Endomicrobiia bacterium]
MKKLIITPLVLATNIFCASFMIYRADVSRQGVVYEVVITSSNPSFLWDIQLQGQILSSPVVKDNIVYFGARDTSLWAIDGLTGEIIWQYSTSGFVDSPPLVWKDFVYTLSTDGKLYCFKRLYSENEEFVPVWTYDSGSKSCGSVLVVEDSKLIFVSGPKKNGLPQGWIYVLNPFNGEFVNKIDLGNFSYSSVSYDGQNIYFTTNDGYVKSYDLTQQKFLWSFKVKSCLNRATVVPYEDKLYFYAGDIERKVYVLDKYGSLVSSSSQLSNFATDNTQVLVSDDNIYVNIYPTSVWNEAGNVVHSSQTLLCLDRENLTVKWRLDFKVKDKPENSYGFTSSPIKVNNIVYFGTNSGEFYAVDSTSGGIIFVANLGSPIICSPAVSNGIIYFGTVDGRFYALKADIYISIVKPDIDDVVINTSTCSVISQGFDNEEYIIKCNHLNDDEGITISSGVLTGENVTKELDFRPLVDGWYNLRFVTPKYNYIIQNKIYVDNSPLPPTNLTAIVVDDQKVILSWTKSIDDGSGNNDVQKYNLYRSINGENYYLIKVLSKGTQSYIDEPLSIATYYYQIDAEDRRSKSILCGPVKVIVAGVPSISKPPTDTFEIKKGSEYTLLYEKNGKKLLEIEFTKESLKQDIVLYISSETMVSNLPKNVRMTNLNYRLIVLSGDREFNSAVKLRIFYDNTDIKELNERRLRMFYYDEITKVWRLLNTSSVNIDKNYVQAEVYHFSLFSIGEFNSESEDIFDEDKVYAFPSPAKGNKVYFRFMLYQPANVKIYVYDLAGDLLWESQRFSYSELDLGKSQTVQWDIRNLATGMYIFRLEGENSKGKQNVVKRFAIIH